MGVYFDPGEQVKALLRSIRDEMKKLREVLEAAQVAKVPKATESTAGSPRPHSGSTTSRLGPGRPSSDGS